MVDSDYTYAPTNFIIQDRFAEIENYTDDALARVLAYTEDLQALLDSLTLPETDDIDDIELPTLTPIDFASLPEFSQVLNEFPSFDVAAPLDPTIDDVPTISTDIPQKNFNFVANSYVAPDVDYGEKPTDIPTLTSISVPTKPDITLPDVPTLDELIISSPPSINIGSFDATVPAIEEQQTPTEFKYDEVAYNSDIRIPLFNKILYDIANGGTGLDVDVESDLYARGVERQRVENERLYNEIQDQFTAIGFNLPSGAYAARLAEVSNEISRKNDQTNREIIISQAELAQNNTQFTTQQAVVLEQMLVNFFNEQQNRTLQASQIAAANAIEVYNAIQNRQRLLLEKYQAEAQVFEIKVRAELNAVEVYRAEIEAVKAKADVNQARVNVYTAQIGGLETIMRLYSTEMESARLQATIQQLEIETFRLKTQAYVAGLDAEKAKIDIFTAQIGSEKTRADTFATEVSAYQTEVSAKLSELEVQKSIADNVIQKNNQAIEVYKSKIAKYQTDVDAEIKAAQLLVDGYNVEATTYEAQVNAKGMEYETRIKETQNKIELARAKVEKALALVNSTSDAYVALKQLQVGATEGIMTTNAQIAASAMGAVNASASQGASYSSSDSDSTSDSFSEVHTYSHDA